MKYKDTECLKEEIEVIGLGVISKLSSINYLARKNVGIEALINLESRINELEAGVWSLLPLAMDDDIPKFESQIKHVSELLTGFIEAAKMLRELNKDR